MSFNIDPIAAFDDNYIWCIHDQNHAWVVDPGCADAVTQFIGEHQLILSGILVTHHHDDHTGGIASLLERFPDCQVVGSSNSKVASLTSKVAEGDCIALSPLELSLNVVELPGHTLDHIGFIGNGMVFCGDTLFSGGCGRLFEGTAEQMYHSLQKLVELPEDTQVYCTHEYTCANLTFATMVEPNNQALKDYQQRCQQQRALQQPTLPSTIAMERAINPFLRCDITAVRSSLEQHSQAKLFDNVSYFAALRRWKDNA